VSNLWLVEIGSERQPGCVWISTAAAPDEVYQLGNMTAVGWRAAINLHFESARDKVLNEIRSAIAPDFAAIRARRAAVSDPGYWECDRCNRSGCEGVIELVPVENCSCHISPPCNACVEQVARCPECDWQSDEDLA
jgi:hypothetical protein